MKPLEKLIADASSNQALMASIIATENLDAAAAKAQELGYELTAEELQAYLETEDIELPGEVLAAVAGGLNKKSSPAVKAPRIGKAAPSLVAAGGGNLVAAGGGNLVAAGGGNLVAAGGGNFKK